MNTPFGDLKSHYKTYKSDLDDAVNRVLASGYFILGPELQGFEQEFAAYLGAKRVVGCASGTDAIYLSLAAAGVGEGDDVLVASHTAVPTICAIRMAGARPVFVDISAQSHLMDVSQLESNITERTRAIVPVHLYGQMVDMDPLMELARKRNLAVIEDCAQATGATYKGRKAGTIGDFGAFSFYPSKNLGAFGDGGCVSTNCEDAARKLSMLRNYGQSRRYYNDMEGVNSRLDELQAAILRTQLPHIETWNQKRREIARRYTQALSEFVRCPQEMDGHTHVYHLYVVETDRRDELIDHLADCGVQALIHYPVPAHLQKAYVAFGYKRGSLPETESSCDRILSLPLYPGLSDEQVDFVIHSIQNYFSKQNKVDTPTKEPGLDADRKSNTVAATSR